MEMSPGNIRRATAETRLGDDVRRYLCVNLEQTAAAALVQNAAALVQNAAAGEVERPPGTVRRAAAETRPEDDVGRYQCANLEQSAVAALKRPLGLFRQAVGTRFDDDHELQQSANLA